MINVILSILLYNLGLWIPLLLILWLVTKLFEWINKKKKKKDKNKIKISGTEKKH